MEARINADEQPERVISSAKKRPRTLVVFITIIVVVSAWTFNTVKRNGKVPRVAPLFSEAGEKGAAVFSPDGRLVVFPWSGGNGTSMYLYVQMVGSHAQPLRLTNIPGEWTTVAWSPDGESIVFTRSSNASDDFDSGIYVVPALGGAERELHRAPKGMTDACVSWSRDGQELAFAEGNRIDYQLLLLTLATGDVRVVPGVGKMVTASCAVAFSPDGESIAHVSGESVGAVDVYVIARGGGAPKRITRDSKPIYGIAWDSDGRSLFIASARDDVFALWRVQIAGGQVERLSIGTQNAMFPNVSRDGSLLSFLVSSNVSSVWAADIRADGTITPTRLIESNGEDGQPQLSPDSSRIVFSSTRTGTSQIWLAGWDGSHPEQLTSVHAIAGTPHWSPNGEFVAFDVHEGKHAGIYIVRPRVGTPKRVTPSDYEAVEPVFSRDGRFIYFLSNRSGDWQVWKIPISGGGAVQVTSNGGMRLRESVTGDRLYWITTFEKPRIWTMSADGSDKPAMLDGMPTVRSGYDWAVGRRGIYFLNADPDPASIELQFFDFATKNVRTLYRLQQQPDEWHGGIDISPDERRVVLTLRDTRGPELMFADIKSR